MNIEFTGERVVPGRVDEDLWNEHLARYAFSERFCRGRRVLDAGCGTGYGANQLALTAELVVGVDIAEDALAYAASEYSRPNLGFVQASCTALPFTAASFDLVVTLSPEAQHRAIELTRTMAVDVEFWNTFDPSVVEGSRAERLEAYRQVRDALIERIKERFPPPLKPS